MRAQVQKKGLFFVVQQIYHDELFKQPPQQQWPHPMVCDGLLRDSNWQPRIIANQGESPLRGWLNPSYTIKFPQIY